MIRHLLIALSILMLCAACHRDDEDLQPAAEKNPLCQVMVVFALGQLGDRGYADNVMEGVNLLSSQSNGNEKDDEQINVSFIASSEERILHWVEHAESPFVEDTCSRRLLVLTEPYMAYEYHEALSCLRPTDEVLLLKVNDDDVKAAAEKLGLGERLHGLNISAAYSMRRYCRYMEKIICDAKELEGKILTSDPISYYRLYDSTYVAYRDSVFETLKEELDASTRINISSISDEFGAGVYTPDFEHTVIESAYLLGFFQQLFYEERGIAFAVIDLGSGNAGWDYSLLYNASEGDTFHTLVIDGSPVPLPRRTYIKRFFSTALADWCNEWVNRPVGGMPPMTTHWGGDYCQDNIPDM